MSSKGDLTYQVLIDCEGSTFDPPSRTQEIARILRDAASRIEAGFVSTITLRDINGNACGFAEFSHVTRKGT